MDFLKAFIKKNIFLLAIFFAVFIFYLPYILTPQFGLLNDGWYIRLAEQTSLTHWSDFLQLHEERSIPFTLMFYVVVLRTVSFSPLGLVLFYFIELAALIAGIYYFSGRKLHGFLAALLILFSSPVVTNTYEFFTQEHISLLLLFIFTWHYFELIKSNQKSLRTQFFLFTSSVIWLLLFFLSKEINFFLLFVFAVSFVFEWVTKKRKEVLRILAAYVGISALWLVYYFYASSNLQSAVGSIYTVANIPHTFLGFIKILNVHWMPVVCSLLYVIVRVVKGRWSYIASISLRHLYFTAIAALSFLVYLPWNAAGRYALLPIVCFYIVFFSTIKDVLSKKAVILSLVAVFVGSAFFAVFDMVRFYGLRTSDANMLSYLYQHADAYDQVCVQGGYAVAEDVLEIEIWVNDIYKLNKSVCTLAPIDDVTSVYREVFSREGIVYGEAINETYRTLVIRREFSHREALLPSSQYEVEPKDILTYSIHNIHPTRGFEKKEFNWHIGYLKNK